MKISKKYVDKFLLIVTSILLSIMTIFSIYQVVARYILGTPSTTSEEIIRFCLVWFALLSAAYVFGKKKHVAIIFIQEKLPKNLRFITKLFIDTLILIVSLILMIWGGYEVLTNTLRQSAPATGVSMGLMYGSLIISGIFVLYYSIYHIVYSDDNEESEKGGDTL